MQVATIKKGERRAFSVPKTKKRFLFLFLSSKVLLFSKQTTARPEKTEFGFNSTLSVCVPSLVIYLLLIWFYVCVWHFLLPILQQLNSTTTNDNQIDHTLLPNWLFEIVNPTVLLPDALTDLYVCVICEFETTWFKWLNCTCKSVYLRKKNFSFCSFDFVLLILFIWFCSFCFCS